ncbi:SLBB domain-containing protein [Lentisphaera marina]|uniref:polysaccharide biosynthesis/export family protein n=1 Tax=Lentisphaera marina TaxID=1111041 RepID=UPI002366381F|nr:SLBB domain-containing protein [Lentisphaera marina]MDD7983526.1 SLBB domain-containing protein [Lentisphaera marina]
MRTIITLLLLMTSTISAEQKTAQLISFGDLVHVSMKEDQEVIYTGEVSTNGFITLPYLGAINISELNEREAESNIKQALEKDLYQKATISVVVVKKAVGYIYIYGAVGVPGKVEIPLEGEISLAQAISEVGGFSKWADPKKAYIIKKNQENTELKHQFVDFEAVYNNLASKANLKLQKNDMIVIPSLADGAVTPGSIEVIVEGKVETPGTILFEPGERPTLVRAIIKAGNFNKFADKSDVRLVRRSAGSTKIIKVDVKEMLEKGQIHKDIKLQSGDLIIIDESWL